MNHKEADYEFTYVSHGIYTLTAHGELVMTGTFEECVAAYEKHFEGGK